MGSHLIRLLGEGSSPFTSLMDPPKSLRNHKRLCKPIMNPATSILFLGLVLSTAQGLQVKSFEADSATPPKGSQVKLTATPDGDWKTCIITLGTKEICKITKTAGKLDGAGPTKD